MAIGSYAMQFVIPTFILLSIICIYGIIVNIPVREYILSMIVVILVNILVSLLIRDFKLSNFTITKQTKHLIISTVIFSVFRILNQVYLDHFKDRISSKFNLSMKSRRIIWYVGILLLILVTIVLTVHEYYNWSQTVINQNFTSMSNDVNFSDFFIRNKEKIYSFVYGTKTFVTFSPIIFAVVLLFGIFAKISLVEYLLSVLAIFIMRITTYFFIRDFHPDNFVLKEHIVLMGKYMELFIVIRIIYEFYLKSKNKKVF